METRKACTSSLAGGIQLVLWNMTSLYVQFSCWNTAGVVVFSISTDTMSPCTFETLFSLLLDPFWSTYQNLSRLHKTRSCITNLKLETPFNWVLHKTCLGGFHGVAMYPGFLRTGWPSVAARLQWNKVLLLPETAAVNEKLISGCTPQS